MQITLEIDTLKRTYISPFSIEHIYNECVELDKDWTSSRPMTIIIAYTESFQFSDFKDLEYFKGAIRRAAVRAVTKDIFK